MKPVQTERTMEQPTASRLEGFHLRAQTSQTGSNHREIVESKVQSDGIIFFHMLRADLSYKTIRVDCIACN